MIPLQQPAMTLEEVSNKMTSSKIANKNLFFTINPPLNPKPETAKNTVSSCSIHNCSS
jgi:hypothetical protein